MHNGFLNLLPRNCGNHHGSRENSSVQRICSHGRIYSAGHYQRKPYIYTDYNSPRNVLAGVIAFLIPRHPHGDSRRRDPGSYGNQAVSRRPPGNFTSGCFDRPHDKTRQQGIGASGFGSKLNNFPDRPLRKTREPS